MPPNKLPFHTFLLSFRRQSSTGSWSKLFTCFPSQLWHAILRCRILLYVPKYMN